MGNIDSSPQQPLAIPARRCNPTIATGKHLLPKKDLDNIYKLVRKMKQDQQGKATLEEFVIRQSEEFLVEDRPPSSRKKDNDESFPIKCIQVDSVGDGQRGQQETAPTSPGALSA